MDTIGLDLHQRESQLCVQAGGAGAVGRPGPKAWAEGIALGRGRSMAAVALARWLAGIRYAMWRDGQDYRAARPSEGGRASP
jgi:hypothetical protein